MPLEDGSVDYVHCGGVIQHTTSPELVLRELARVLRPGGRGRIMVYNRDSLYFHLYTAYTRRILEGLFDGLTPDEAFARNTDGPKCPISRAFRPSEFCELARGAGFEIEFLGGYYADIELELWRDTGADALAEPRLGDEHRDFLRRVTDGADGYPEFEGSYAGVGGVYAEPMSSRREESSPAGCSADCSAAAPRGLGSARYLRTHWRLLLRVTKHDLRLRTRARSSGWAGRCSRRSWCSRSTAWSTSRSSGSGSRTSSAAQYVFYVFAGLVPYLVCAEAICRASPR